jgi:integrase
MARKVTLYLRIHEGYAFVKPVWEGKRLKPLWGLLKDVPTHCPDALGYYLRYTKDGKQITKPIGKDATDAVTFLRKMEAILRAQADGLEVKVEERRDRLTVEAAIEDYVAYMRGDGRHPDAIKNRQHHLRLFTKFCHKRYVDEIVRSDLIAFRDQLAKSFKPATVSNRLMTAAVFLKYHGNGGHLKAADFPETPFQPHPYTQEEIESLFAVCDENELLLLRFFKNTGCRDLEVAHACFSDIEWEKKIFWIQAKSQYNWKPKTKSSTRWVSLSDDLLADLKIRQSENDLIFPNRNMQPNYHLLAILKRVAKRAGVADAYLHRFRDLFATEMLDRGNDVVTVAARLGHKDLKTIQAYKEVRKAQDPKTRQDANDLDYKPKPTLVNVA